jgi:type III secretory pathway component EscS
MNNKTKNIITNIIGIILLIVNVVMYYKDDETLTSFVTILVISLALFLFKGTETKEWLKKALSKFSS